MSDIKDTMQKVQAMEVDVVTPKPPQTNTEDHDSNEGNIAIVIRVEPLLCLNDNNNDDFQQPLPSDDFIMVLDNEESNHFEHSTSKPK